VPAPPWFRRPPRAARRRGYNKGLRRPQFICRRERAAGRAVDTGTRGRPAPGPGAGERVARPSAGISWSWPRGCIARREGSPSWACGTSAGTRPSSSPRIANTPGTPG